MSHLSTEDSRIVRLAAAIGCHSAELCGMTYEEALVMAEEQGAIRVDWDYHESRSYRVRDLVSVIS